MRQNEVIKTNLCIVLAVLVVTAAGLATALAMDGSRTSEPDQAQIQPAKMNPIAETDDDMETTNIPEQAQEHTEDVPTQTVDAAVQPQQTDTTTYALRTRDGYLQVYILETGEFYMETSIVYRLLPESVQAQIDHGKYFESEEELFEFLENYSS